MNIGFCLATTNCGLTSPPGALPYWGYSNGSADPNVYFAGNGSAGGSASLQLTIAGNADINQFGWVQTNSSGGIIGSLNPLFSGLNATGQTVGFTPTAYFAFFLVGADGTYYTVSGQNPNDPNAQHFAFFQGPNATMWIGSEDLPLASSDQDYNDLVVELQPAVFTPEPASLVLMGTLLGIAVLMHKAVPAH
jgi:hypothetical protein